MQLNSGCVQFSQHTNYCFTNADKIQRVLVMAVTFVFLQNIIHFDETLLDAETLPLEISARDDEKTTLTYAYKIELRTILKITAVTVTFHSISFFKR